MTWAELVTCMRKVRDAAKLLLGGLNVRHQVGEDNIKADFKEIGCKGLK
jgi:hypothetical protein